MENKHLGRKVFILTNKMKRLLDKSHQNNGIYLGQARVLTYLYRHQDEKIYQKDIENFFQIRGGTVTGMLDSLNKINLINRIESKTDKRKRRVVLTDEGVNKALEALDTINSFELMLENSLTLDETILFEKVLDKLNNKIDEEENR